MSSWHVVPDQWKPLLRAYLRATCGEDREHLTAHDFRCDQSVHVHFADGSFALFQCAFAIPDEAGRAVMVFTEHCGYHVFPVEPDGVQIVRSTPLGVSVHADRDAAADGGREPDSS